MVGILVHNKEKENINWINSFN